MDLVVYTSLGVPKARMMGLTAHKFMSGIKSTEASWTLNPITKDDNVLLIKANFEFGDINSAVICFREGDYVRTI